MSSSGSGPGARRKTSKGISPQTQAMGTRPAAAGIPPSSSSSTSKAAVQLTKSGPRITRSEDLLDKMKSCGYNLPRHQQRPEQFDYLFQDKNTVAFLQKLTAKITNQNVLGQDEMSAIQQLKAENRAVYGKTLETLVEKSRKERQLRLNISLEKDEELLELKRRINLKKETIQKLKQMESKFIKDRENQAASQALIVYETEQIEKDCQRIRQEYVEISKDQPEAIGKYLAALRKEYEECARPLIVLAEFPKQALQLEEAVQEGIKDIFEGESEILDKSDTPYEIGKILEQDGKDLERLKHVIIHETIHQIWQDWKNEEAEGINMKFQDFSLENERAAHLPEIVRSKMAMEKRDRIDRLKLSIERLTDKKLGQLRQKLVKKFEEETEALQFQKHEMRKHIGTHLDVFENVLLQQVVILAICDEILECTEWQLHWVHKFRLFLFKRFFGDLKMKLNSLRAPITEANLTPEDQATATLFKSHGIPLEILRNPETTKYALSLVALRANQLMEKGEAANEKLITQSIKSLFKQHGDLRQQWEATSKIREEWDINWTSMETQQEKVHQFEEETKSHLLTKSQQVKEAIKENEMLLIKMKEFLHDRRARVEAAAKAEEARLLECQKQKRRRSSMFGQTFDFSFAS